MLKGKKKGQVKGFAVANKRRVSSYMNDESIELLEKLSAMSGFSGSELLQLSMAFFAGELSDIVCLTDIETKLQLRTECYIRLTVIKDNLEQLAGVIP